jgi:hypothetical protein
MSVQQTIFALMIRDVPDSDANTSSVQLLVPSQDASTRVYNGPSPTAYCATTLLDDVITLVSFFLV